MTIHTKHHLGGGFRWKPEYNEGQRGQKNTGEDENVAIERWFPLQDHGEGQVWVRLITTRVVFDVPLSRMVHQIPLIALDIVSHVYHL